MISPPRPPADHYGTRLSICATIALITACLFFIYDGVAHRAAPTAPSVYQEASRARDYRPGAISNWVSLVPDMTSSAVGVANEDVSLPAQFRLVENAPAVGNFAKAEATPEKR